MMGPSINKKNANHSQGDEESLDRLNRILSQWDAWKNPKKVEKKQAMKFAEILQHAYGNDLYIAPQIDDEHLLKYFNQLAKNFTLATPEPPPGRLSYFSKRHSRKTWTNSRSIRHYTR